MKRPVFDNYEYYHIHNRGVADVKIFKDVKDFMHFLACLKEFNTEKGVEFRELQKQKKLPSLSLPNIDSAPLIEIVAYGLMPNHFHLIFRQLKDFGIVTFMQKLGTGYTMYYNARHKSRGHIFLGKYLSQHLGARPHLLYASGFIHTNPLRKTPGRIFHGEISEHHMQKLSFYPWSSLADYVGNTTLYIDMPELKYVKPAISKDKILSVLDTRPYLDYLKNQWPKEKIYIVDKRLL